MKINFPVRCPAESNRRVAIASCIVMEPRLLMLDEPLSNLDAKLRNDMRYELKTYMKDCILLRIYVTHDQQEALALSRSNCRHAKWVIFNRSELRKKFMPNRPTSLLLILWVFEISGRGKLKI